MKHRPNSASAFFILVLASGLICFFVLWKLGIFSNAAPGSDNNLGHIRTLEKDLTQGQ
ncbi:MAG: hypothetical protein JO026_03555 [Patescibacteria group bacterium]|nr:hypothetical protein [Patescibacteria group bacterium]